MADKKNEVAKADKPNQWLTKDEKNIIRKQFFPPGATDIEMQYCMKVAESLNLNPILKQIYFVPRKSKVDNKWIEKIEPLAGRDSFLLLAHKSGIFESMSASVEIVDKPILVQTNNKPSEWAMVSDLSATAIVYKKGFEKPFSETVYFSEYAQYTKDGNLTKFWKDKPITMLKKVAESQVLRKAFNITGLYASEELHFSNDGKIKAELNTEIAENANKESFNIEDAEIIGEEKTEKFTNNTGRKIENGALFPEQQNENEVENEDEPF